MHAVEIGYHGSYDNNTVSSRTAVNMAQTGEGAYFRIRATRLKYNTSPLQQMALPTISSLRSSSHRTDSTLVLSSNTAAR